TTLSSKSSLDAKFSLRCCGSRMNHLFQPDLGVIEFTLSFKRSVHLFCFPFRPARNNHQILLSQPAPLHEQSKFSSGRRCFRNEDKTTRFAVEPGYDRNLTAVGNFKNKQFTQLLPKCWCAVWLGGMDEKKRRFIHDNVIVRLVDDLEME